MQLSVMTTCDAIFELMPTVYIMPITMPTKCDLCHPYYSYAQTPSAVMLVMDY